MDELEKRKLCEQTFSEAWKHREQWLPLWRDLNDAFYPYLYQSLLRSNGATVQDPVLRNKKLLDSTPAFALFTLAAGFMNGVTSPARKWLRVKRPTNEAYAEPDAETSEVHEEIQSKLLEIFSASNYYESRAIQLMDGCGLGTSLILCYEDRDTVATFTVCSPGTYSFIIDGANKVIGVVREFQLTLSEALATFGETALSKEQARQAKLGGTQSASKITIRHLIEQNGADSKIILANTPYREAYWQTAGPSDAPKMLATYPLYEWPCSVFRWHCPDGLRFGVPPTATVLGKAVQLQNLEYKSDQGLDIMVNPPLLADVSLRNRPKAFQASGITYTNNLSPNSGARPLMQINVPFQELEAKRQSISTLITDGLFNPLFNMISQLDTVRSATEIDARREEKLIMLGPVLQRCYNEDLRPLVQRVYGIARRKGLVPELPPGATSLEFNNILSDVQKASDVSTIERFFQFTGGIMQAFPEVQQKIDANELLKRYAQGLGITPKAMVPDQDAVQAVDEQGQLQQLAQISEIAKNFSGAGGAVDQGGGLQAVQAGL